MGTWDTGSFDNDEAADWLGELEDADDAGPIMEALLAVTENEEQVEAPEAQQALAAAEVVAAMNERPVANLPEEAAAWVGEPTRQPSVRELDLARRAVDRVRADSELKELWEEQDPSAWYEKMDDLKARLAPSSSA